MSKNPKISIEAADSIKKAIRIGLRPLEAVERQRLSDWAAESFVMAGESSQQKGGWTAWVFQIGMMDFMSDDRIEDLYIVKSKRVGYTKMITGYVAYCIAHLRRNLALWQPTDDDRDSYVKSEIDPVLDQIAAVKAVRKKRARDTDTMKLKQFIGASAHFLGGKASRAFRRITVATSILDEWSKFDSTIEKTGDAKGLAKGRLEGAAYPKFIGGSTPLIKGHDQAETACELAEGMVRFYIECPHCDAEHPLLWGGKDKEHGFKWDSGKPHTVRHVCPHCRESITQAEVLKQAAPRDGVWKKGAWVCEKTGKRYGRDRIWRDEHGNKCRPPKTLGVHVWSAYSPQRSWTSIVVEQLEAAASAKKGDFGPMQLFTNETLGQTWEIRGDSSDEHVLQERAKAEGFMLGIVPAGALALTAGVDVQRDRWEIGVWGWGRGLESWSIDHAIIEGNPASEEDWVRVYEYLMRRYPQAWATGCSIGLSGISIDSSDQTQDVYNWVRKHQSMLPNLRAIKGSSESQKPILMPASAVDVNWKGQKIPNGLRLWQVGVDTAKDLLLGQLSIMTPGPGFVHMAADLPREWFEQLTAEHRILTKVGGQEVYKWVKRRPRNEVMDCRNYALHSAFGLGLHNYTDAQWAQLERVVQPSTDMLKAGATESKSPTVIEAATPREQEAEVIPQRRRFRRAW